MQEESTGEKYEDITAAILGKRRMEELRRDCRHDALQDLIRLEQREHHYRISVKNKLTKEFQGQSFEMQNAQALIAYTRYMTMAVEQREKND